MHELEEDSQKIFLRPSCGMLEWCPFGDAVDRTRKNSDLLPEKLGYQAAPLPEDQRTKMNFGRRAAMLQAGEDPEPMVDDAETVMRTTKEEHPMQKAITVFSEHGFPADRSCLLSSPPCWGLGQVGREQGLAPMAPKMQLHYFAEIGFPADRSCLLSSPPCWGLGQVGREQGRHMYCAGKVSSPFSDFLADKGAHAGARDYLH